MPTNEVLLDFSNLANLDKGKLNNLLKFHLERSAADCVARPFEKGARKVKLEFTITPAPDDDEQILERADVRIECKSSVPTYKSRKYEMRVGKAGFKFNSDFPDKLDQAPLPFGGEEEREDDDEL